MPEKSLTITHGIKKVLLDNIYEAEKSIIIAMAWFTDNEIKDALIIKKTETPKVRIEIVVDPNDTNKKYFFDYQQKFEEAGIILRNRENKKFLHHKFMLIDELIVITGSYNYSKKAQSNSEEINWRKSKKAYVKLEKEFRFITDKDYVDENIKLLLSYPKFAQQLVSMHYKFTLTEYKRYKSKIVLGDCYSYPTGFIDRIGYIPGIIFNTEITFKIDAGHQEFPIPLDKRAVTKLTNAILTSHTLDSYRDYPQLYHEINGELKKNEKRAKLTFSQKLNGTFEAKKIKKLIEDDIDLIVEDYFWLNNFAPYINKAILARLFDTFETVRPPNGFGEFSGLQ